jgi:hypothetical protein
VPNIFISYRRGDAAGHAGRLADGLSSRFGRERVFMDLDSITPGVNFEQRIHQAIGSCDVALVLIGDQWLHITGDAGNRRLDDESDYVRQEVAAALQRADVTVLPVLVEGANPPAGSELPSDLKPLATIEALDLSDKRWHYDFGRLCEVIRDSSRERAGRPVLGSLGSAWARIRALPLLARLAPLLLLGAGIAVAVVSSSGGGSAKVEPGLYRGQISGGFPLTFVVTRGDVTRVSFQGTSTCQSSAGLPERALPYRFQALPTTRAHVGSDGAFRIQVNFPEQTFRMQGSFSHGRAEGNLEWAYTADANGNGPLSQGSYRCDTGPSAWTVTHG